MQHQLWHRKGPLCWTQHELVLSGARELQVQEALAAPEDRGQVRKGTQHPAAPHPPNLKPLLMTLGTRAWHPLNISG